MTWVYSMEIPNHYWLSWQFPWKLLQYRIPAPALEVACQTCSSDRLRPAGAPVSRLDWEFGGWDRAGRLRHIPMPRRDDSPGQHFVRLSTERDLEVPHAPVSRWVTRLISGLRFCHLLESGCWQDWGWSYFNTCHMPCYWWRSWSIFRICHLPGFWWNGSWSSFTTCFYSQAWISYSNCICH